jgi:outer membrane protein assembly factor BamD (BamD/ComL family)
MRKLKAAELIALILVCLFCFSACQESTEAKYERAQRLLADKKYFEASNLFDEISAYEDSSKMSMYTKAIALAEKGDYAAATSSFRALGDFKDCSLMITYYTGRKYQDQANATEWSH